MLPRCLRSRTVFNRIKRATFGVQACAVMREARTFRFDAAKPLSNNRLEKEIFYIINVHAPLTEPHSIQAPRRQSKIHGMRKDAVATENSVHYFITLKNQ